MLGYAAMNRTLREHDPPRRCNRDMRKRTWEREGLERAAELTERNFEDLLAILRWNLDNGIRFYRCSSTLVPWNSQFELSELPNYDRIASLATQCGALIRDNGVRLTFHPDHWCKLASESADTVERSVESVEHHGRWLDLLGLPRSPRYAINVHIGAHYGDKAATADRFCAVVDDLAPRARERLVVENDDTDSLWGVTELVDAVADAWFHGGPDSPKRLLASHGYDIVHTRSIAGHTDGPCPKCGTDCVCEAALAVRSVAEE